MEASSNLRRYLALWAAGNPLRGAVAETVEAIAAAAVTIAEIIARGPLSGALGEAVGDNADGDTQKALDLRADRLLMATLRSAPVALIGSEEQDEPVALDPGAPLAVAIDPLDGSSNIDTNLSIGSIFAILPMAAAAEDPLLQPGRNQLAAGFVIYGPRTALVLTLGAGTQIFTLDPRSSTFLLTEAQVRISPNRKEYAINASNYRHWEEPVRTYIDDCLSGAEGPRGEDFNMRWIASLVAEAFRILRRGGIFLYPRDDRPGYETGRLRLVYEANPIAFLVEQAGGGATDGEQRILDIQPQALHQRVPLVFGSSEKVERVARYYGGSLHAVGERSPLFARRGLFRA